MLGCWPSANNIDDKLDNSLFANVSMFYMPAIFSPSMTQDVRAHDPRTTRRKRARFITIYVTC